MTTRGLSSAGTKQNIRRAHRQMPFPHRPMRRAHASVRASPHPPTVLELGVSLLTRVGRAAQLTVAGRTFLDHARRLLELAEASAIATRRASEGIVGRLVVGFVSPATYSVLPAIFRAFRERAPEVALELRQLSSGAQAEALRAREIDVGILHPPVEGAPLLGLRVIVEQPFVAAVPARHPLAAESAIRPEALAGEGFIIFPRRGVPGAAAERECLTLLATTAGCFVSRRERREPRGSENGVPGHG
jgi:DNA-binding transcriptional LysR family regulator